MNPFEPLIGTSAAADSLRRAIESAARTSGTVAILGGPGSGKTLAAEVLHMARGRPGAYVRVMCADAARSTPASVFFGGPMDPGVLDRAAGGTIHFEEIAHLPRDHQDFLRRLMDRQEIAVRDIRLVASTRERPTELVGSRRFDAGLFLSLSLNLIQVPPLCERGKDVAELACRFWDGWTKEALDLLPYHAWPGNVRELMELCTALRTGPATLGTLMSRLDIALDPRDRLWTLLHEAQGDVTRVALRLGVTVPTIQRRMATLGIPRGAGRCG